MEQAEGSKGRMPITLLLGFLPSLQLLRHKTFKFNNVENRVEANTNPNKRNLEAKTILGEEPHPTLLPNKNLLNRKNKKESGI